MSRVRAGKLIFRDPVLLCGVVYLLLYFDASGFLRLGLLAAVLHELGHIFVYCIQQRHLPVIEVTMTGFCMRTAGERLSPRQRLVLAAAGPAVNFALAGVWALRLAQSRYHPRQRVLGGESADGAVQPFANPAAGWCTDGGVRRRRCGSKNTESAHNPPETIAKPAHLG